MYKIYFAAKFALIALGLVVGSIDNRMSSISANAGSELQTAKTAVSRERAARLLSVRALRLQNTELSQLMGSIQKQNEDLRREASEAAAHKKVFEVAIVDLRNKLSHAEAAAYLRYQGEVAAMTDRLTKYITDSDANLAQMKAGLESVQDGLKQAQSQSRFAIARAIVKRRIYQANLKTIASLREELARTKDASANVAIALPADSPPPAITVATNNPANASPAIIAPTASAALPLSSPQQVTGVVQPTAGTMQKATAAVGSAAVIGPDGLPVKAVKKKQARKADTGFSFFD